MPVLQYFNLGRVLILFHAHSNLNMISNHLVASGINFWTFEIFRKSTPPNVSISLRNAKMAVYGEIIEISPEFGNRPVDPRTSIFLPEKVFCM